jgi:hypothetical protein
VVIKPSSEKAVDRLISDLSSGETIPRDAAVARLTVIGARAVHRLISVAASPHADAPTRSAAFRALEAIADPRSLDVALGGMAHENAEVAAAAAGVVRALLGTEKDMAALDRLAAVALDRERATAVRLVALRALIDLGPGMAAPVLAQLSRDPDTTVAEVASAPPEQLSISPSDPLKLLQQTAEGGVAVEPVEVRRALAQLGAKVPLTTLLQLIERARERERATKDAVREEWVAVRASAHAALSEHGSRLALYDLRETFEAATMPLAVEFVAAMMSVGDASCLDAVAGAYARAASGAPAREDWWRRSLADVFRAIVQREGLTRRHAVTKRIERRWPGLFRLLVTDNARKPPIAP